MSNYFELQYIEKMLWRNNAFKPLNKREGSGVVRDGDERPPRHVKNHPCLEKAIPACLYFSRGDILDETSAPERRLVRGSRATPCGSRGCDRMKGAFG
jgi:hypothetical protein